MGPGDGWMGPTLRKALSECVLYICPALVAFAWDYLFLQGSGPGVDGRIWGYGLEPGFWRLTCVFVHRNWAPLQPDNWFGHGLGGGEDCAHITTGGPWNDDVCQRTFRWICEMKLAKES